MIELPSRGERDYLAQFGVTAVYVTSSGKLGVGRDLARVGAIAAWWARDIATAEAVLVAIGAACPVTIEQATAEVQAAAGRLGVTLSSHDVVMERAKAAVAKLATQSAGLLSAFNREFKERRLRANAAGARFMTYASARRRLARALASFVATGATPGVDAGGLRVQGIGLTGRRFGRLVVLHKAGRSDPQVS